MTYCFKKSNTSHVLRVTQNFQVSDDDRSSTAIGKHVKQSSFPCESKRTF